MFMQSNERLIDQPALIGLKEVIGGFGELRLLFVPGHQNAQAQRSLHLHGRNATARRQARGGLQRQRRHARHFQCAI